MPVNVPARGRDSTAWTRPFGKNGYLLKADRSAPTLAHFSLTQVFCGLWRRCVHGVLFRSCAYFIKDSLSMLPVPLRRALLKSHLHCWHCWIWDTMELCPLASGLQLGCLMTLVLWKGPQLRAEGAASGAETAARLRQLGRQELASGRCHTQSLLCSGCPVSSCSCVSPPSQGPTSGVLPCTVGCCATPESAPRHLVLPSIWEVPDTAACRAGLPWTTGRREDE